MEAVHFSAVASRHFSSSSLPPHCTAFSSSRYARNSTKFHSAWTGSSNVTSLSSRNLFAREIWGWVNCKSVVKRKMRNGIVRAEMFGQLTSGLEAAWSKLKGEAAC